MINLNLKHKLLRYKFIYYLLYLKHRFNLNFEKGEETKKIKQKIILTLKNKGKYESYFETGLWYSHNIIFLRKYFNKITGIELNREFYKLSKNFFSKDKDVLILQGNSSIIIKNQLKYLKQKTLFFLDAHYSKDGTSGKNIDNPIIHEIKAIISHKIKNHTLIIDNLSEFIKPNKGYPKIEIIKKLIKKNTYYKIFSLKNDLIIIVPN